MCANGTATLHRHLVDAGGWKIAYERGGAGPALVLLPGAGSSVAAMRDAGYVSLLADRFTVIGIDPLGHGRSDRPEHPAPYAMERQVERIDQVLDREGFTAAHVWGYSGGATIAQCWAACHPRRVRGLVIGDQSIGVSGDLFRALYAPAVDALRAGDWAGWWAADTAVYAADVRRRVEAEADLPAMANAVTATFQIDVSPTALPQDTFVYAAAHGPLAEFVAAQARDLGIRSTIIPGHDHGSLFLSPHAIAPAVRAFLVDTERTLVRASAAG